MPEAAAAHHGHHHAAGRGYGGQRYGDAVAHAAGGMLVHLHPFYRREVQFFPGKRHGPGKGGGFGGRKAVEEGGHQPGGKLVVGDAPVGRAHGDELELGRGHFQSGALLKQQVQHFHRASQITLDLSSPSSRALIFSETFSPSSSTSSWVRTVLEMPLVKLETQQRAATRTFSWRAVMVSGTTDIPAMSPPSRRYIFTSAGVS